MKFPRIMIGATSSGSGKTLLTCGLLQALKNRSLNVSAFKCGPDYIDPMFHKKIINVPSRNLDTYFTDDETTKYLFTKAAKDMDISVIEGVMGFYDGVGGTSITGSSYELSKMLGTPTILVMNAKGMSLSVAAMIKGFVEFRKDNTIQGIILNQVSEMFYPELKRVMEQELSIPVLGYLPKVEELVLESRHLGLVMPDEIEQIEHKVNALANLLEQTIDIDQLLAIAAKAPELPVATYSYPVVSHTPRIAVARDEAFCFYYEDNLELLEHMGAKLVHFSPLHDEKIPDDIQGLILGGGYPELYAKQLSGNQSMLMDVKRHVKEGRPMLAECGGFMYLHDTMEDNEAISYPMVGAIKGHVHKTNKLGRFGYIALTAKDGEGLLPVPEQIRGHEFHYFDSSNCGTDFLAKKPLRNREWSCIHSTKNQVVGFPHLYYYSNPMFLYRFLCSCIE